MIKKCIGSMGVILLTYALAAMVACFGLVGKTGAADGEAKFASPERHAALASKAETGGKVRIIVGVHGNFVPEPTLTGAGVESQRKAIAGAQDHVISELAARGSRPAKFHKYKYVPFAAMTVDSNTLKALASLPGVVSIEEDVPAGVSRAESSTPLT